MPTVSRTDNSGAARTSRPAGGNGTTAAAYPAREDTFLLIPFARVDAGTSFLEIGAGSGLLALTAARRGARVVATDLNPDALRALAATARTERLDLAAVRTDLAKGLGRFDRIVANPPYLPTRPEERDPDRWHNLALDGGQDGWTTSARIVASLPDLLRPEGSAFLLTSTLQSLARRAEILSSWRANGGTVVRVADRAIEGERLQVFRFRLGARTRPTWPARRTRGPRRGTGARRRIRPDRRSE
jgi:release factor glutamine methyltransferase